MSKVKFNNVKIKAIKPGVSYLTADYGDYAEAQNFYVHKSLVITDNNFFGKSSCSEVIPISI